MEVKGNLKSVLSTELAGYLADTGSVNAYAVALRPAITAYTTGLKITFQATNTNTGASTLAVNGLAAKSILKNVTDSLDTGDILANKIIMVIYDGTNFQLIGANQLNKISFEQISPLDELADVIVSKAGTVTGAVGIGSSLFLQRMVLPAIMNITEIDVAMSIGFPATNQGAGTMSRSMVIYSLGNSTSLASMVSISGTSAWSTGTSTTAGAVSLTQFQGGWSSPLIQPMTFASSSLGAGEYVVGMLFNFAQASSTWTLNLYGARAMSTFLASAATNLTSATLAAMSSAALLAGSVHTATGSVAGISNAGTLAVNNYEQSSNTHAGSAVSAIATNTSLSTKTFSVQSRTIFSAAPTAASALSSGGLSAGSFFTAATGSLSAVTNVALGALSSTTLAQLTLPNFGYIGTGSTTSNFPTVFINGIMSTGAIPVAITLTSTAVTYSGSYAFQQPWFCLIGS